jgi:diguanylate cyclase (GGDEF)-like protein
VLARLAQTREAIAKEWLVRVITSSPLAAVGQIPMQWVTTDLPELVGDLLSATGEPRGTALPKDAVKRVLDLTGLREEPDPAQVGAEVATLQSVLLAAMRRELLGVDPELFAEAAERLAALFAPLTGATVEALAETGAGSRDPLTGLAAAAAMRPRLDQLVAIHKRYGYPFAMVLFDVDSLTSGGDQDPEHVAAIATVAAALRESVRDVDEGYRLENDELCLLAPSLGSEGGARMAERLSNRLSTPGVLDASPLSIAAGVVACPEHGEDPERLLRQADTAMWRARATGRPVTVAGLQDPSHSP